MRTNYGTTQEEIDQREGEMMQEILIMKYNNAIDTEKEMRFVALYNINHTSGNIYKVREIMKGRYSLWSDDGKYLCHLMKYDFEEIMI